MDIYHEVPSLNEFYMWIDQICVEHDIVTCGNVGYSYEGREIKWIELNMDESSETKPIVFLEGTLHAREWMSLVTLATFIDKV